MVTLSLVTKSDQAWGPTFSLLTEIVLDHGDEFAQTHISTTDMDDLDDSELDDEVYHDENTLSKTYDAVRNVVARYLEVDHRDDMTDDILTSLQNAGILFRERK